MPVIQGPSATAPAPNISAWGLVRFPRGQKNVTELHFHDCDEYFCMISGNLVVRSEGVVYSIGPRDVFLTRMGDEHEILEILEDTEYFWFETELKGRNRPGHLHRPADD